MAAEIMDTATPQKAETILIVDDIPDNITVLSGVLRQNGYDVRAVRSGRDALRTSKREPPDLVLLDVMMPEMDGYEVCRQFKADEALKDIPIIFLSAATDSEVKVKGFSCGGADFVCKPFETAEVLARIRTHLSLHSVERELQRRLKERTATLEATTEALRASEREMAHLRDATIVAMASLAETRDNDTAHHIHRTQNYVRVLAQALSASPRFSVFLTPEIIDLLYKTSALHDIGKVGIPDHILLKPGALTAGEFEIIKSHTTLGRDAIRSAERMLATPSLFLTLAREIAYSHHERWDGKGYPQGLANDTIPVSARLMSIADVYDAITSRRVYKPAMTHEDAVATIQKGRGTQFDPDMVDAFLESAERFRQIAALFAASGSLPGKSADESQRVRLGPGGPPSDGAGT